MESNESTILQGLNPAQREAVVNYDTASLIIAGAGSGKTRVLTSRIAYMIQQGVAPYNILALTFTNKAAAQMRERIAQMIPENRCRYIRMGTFHSVFSRILRENARQIGFPDSFTIYEPSDVKNLLKTIVRELNLADEKYKPNMLASRISYAKNCLITPGAYLASSAYATEDRQAQIPEFGNIYNIYCQRCKRNGAMDFDDLLLQTNILLRDCPEVLARYQEQFRYILVDEYQDTNYAQYVIIRRLSQHHSKVCVVGDDAQSIYSFRGAKIENILKFQQDFPEAMVFKLEQNYRSTRTIVEAANSVIARNAKRLEKKCFSEGDAGEKIRVLKAYTDREEAELVVTDLRDRVRAADDAWAEAAILYRTNNQSKQLEDELRRRGVPYRIYKGSSFYDHKEIKDLLAYIRLVVNPRDDEAFKRIVNYPARGIGDTTVERIAQLAAGRGVSMWEAVDALVAEPVQDAVQKAIARKVTDFVAMIRALSLCRSEQSIYDFGLEIASRSGILAAYRTENTPEATSALDNIEELLNSMKLFSEQVEAEIRGGERPEEDKATIDEWLQQVMLMTDMDKDDPEDRNRVTLMTVHSAKGLEYKYVYIVGLEENLFPSQRAAESPDGMEEERRLFYVALTRAKVAATISYAEMRFKWGNMEFSRPSCFLREIDPRYIERDEGIDEEGPLRDEAGGTAIDELRRRFDYRFQQKQGGERPGGYGANAGRTGFAGGGYGGRTGNQERQGGSTGGGFGRRPADGESGVARRFPRAAQGASGGSFGSPQPRSQSQQPAVQPPRPSTEGLRRLGARPAGDAGAGAGDYAVGQLVEHPKFGAGTVQRIEMLATDQKLVVDFGAAGVKTLLAKFAKLTKL
ncbi:ATP-dependent helicase [Alistipes sp.]|uniref:ATP-dependent helicase n=1 Tax=Alistipes sp. TaxID=1872444 RepID=UPI003AF1A55A